MLGDKIMKKFFFKLSLAFIILLFASCKENIQTVETSQFVIPAHLIQQLKNNTSTTETKTTIKLHSYIECGDYKIEKIHECKDDEEVVLEFNNIPAYTKGTIYIAVVNDYSNDYISVKNVADYEIEQDFYLMPNKQSNIELKCKEAEKYTIKYSGFYEIGNIIDWNDYIFEKVFTKHSDLLRDFPLPIGTTRWSIYYNYDGVTSWNGFFLGEIKCKELIDNYYEYFYDSDFGYKNCVNFEPTGEPEENINTPLVYLNENYSYSFVNDLNSDGATDLGITWNDYCFDNAGNLYLVMENQLYKIAYDFSNNKYEGLDTSFLPNNTGIESVSYDIKQNKLAVYYIETSNNAPYINLYGNPAGSIYKNINYSYPTLEYGIDITPEFDMYSFYWTSYNENIYEAIVSGKSIQIKIYNLETGSDGLSKYVSNSSVVSDDIDLDLERGGIYCKDIIYHNNNIYVLFTKTVDNDNYGQIAQFKIQGDNLKFEKIIDLEINEAPDKFVGMKPGKLYLQTSNLIFELDTKENKITNRKDISQ